MIGERCRRGQRVLDRRKLFDLGRRARPVPVVKVVAEEILVILIVPGVALFRRRLFFLFFLRGFDRLELFGRHFLEHRVLDHLLIEELRQLERRHRQQLDRLLQ